MAADDMAAALAYSRDLFEEVTAARLLGHFHTLVAGALEDPARPLSALPLLSPAERHQILAEWVDTAAEPLPAAVLKL